jgi:hypothetical protein
MRDHPTPICPSPGPGQCVQKRGNFCDAAADECIGDCCATSDPIDATAKPELDTPCVIQFCEDYD